MTDLGKLASQPAGATVRRYQSPRPTGRARSTTVAGVKRIVLDPPESGDGLMTQVNVYIVDDDPLTLIDGGWRSDAGLQQLEQALAGIGRRVTDIELLVITHQHVDHIGLASEIVRLSGADVAAFHLLVPVLQSFDARYDEEEPLVRGLLTRHGAPPEAIATARIQDERRRGLTASVNVTRPLMHGSELRLHRRTLAVLHLPGHSPSDVVLHDADHRALIAGDHLLRDIPPVPTIAQRLEAHEAGDWRFPAFPTYLRSLATARATDVDVVLSGHGRPISEHHALIDKRMSLYDRQADRILAILRDRPLTAFEIASAIWGETAELSPLVSFSRVLGHTDLLSAGGRVREVIDGGIVRFEVTPPECPGSSR